MKQSGEGDHWGAPVTGEGAPDPAGPQPTVPMPKAGRASVPGPEQPPATAVPRPGEGNRSQDVRPGPGTGGPGWGQPPGGRQPGRGRGLIAGLIVGTVVLLGVIGVGTYLIVDHNQGSDSTSASSPSPSVSPSASASTPSTAASSGNPFGFGSNGLNVGDCVTRALQKVGCATPQATYRIQQRLQGTTDTARCPQGSTGRVGPGGQSVLCLQPVSSGQGGENPGPGRENPGPENPGPTGGTPGPGATGPGDDGGARPNRSRDTTGF